MAITLGEFVQRLADSGLMSSEEIQTFHQSLPNAAQMREARELAWELVRAKRLTEFQAKALYNGKLKKLVFGQYVILEKIGAGGMGQVFKAMHRAMERVVALKILPDESARSPDIVQRFQREVKAAARLQHPHIVTAHDAGEESGTLYLVMEHVSGRDMRDIVHERGTLPVARAVDMMIQAATGFAHAHSEGIIHRDIKPANLLVDKKGTVKILDMGLARFQDSGGADVGRLTMAGQMLGTVEYMPPEQAEDTRHADVRSDIYSLGATLHYLLVGQGMYPRDSIIEAIEAHLTAPLPDLKASRPDVPDELCAVFQKMVAKSPDDRYQSMDDVIRELKACPGLAEAADLGGAPVSEMESGDTLNRMPGQAARESDEDSDIHSHPVRVNSGTGSSLKLTSESAIGLDLDDLSIAQLFDDSGIAPGSSLGGSSSERLAAEWVVQVRGKVVVREGDTSIRSNDAKDLPPGDVKVQTISLEYNKMITDDDLVRIETLSEITRVYLHGTRITDRGLQHLKNAKSLEYLSLGKTKVTDVGISHIAHLNKLKHLGLYSTRVTDRSVEYLKRLSCLEELIVDNTSISASGVAELKQHLPTCEITH